MNDLDQLMRTFHFTRDDLKANREGRLSKRQYRRIKDRWTNRIAQLLVIFTILISLCYFYRLVLIFILIYLISVGLAFFILQRDMRIDFANPLGAVCGTLEKLPLSFQIIIENKLFDLNKNEYQILEENKAYCAYYLSQSQKIMSICSLQQILENPFEEEN